MGANAATKMYKVVNNLENILAIEMLCASQAITFNKNKSSDIINKIVSEYRNHVDFLDEDRALYKDIEKTVNFLRTFHIEKDVF